MCKVTNYPCKVTTKRYTVQNNQSVNLLFGAFTSCPAQVRDACKVCMQSVLFQVALRRLEMHGDACKVYLSKLPCAGQRCMETHASVLPSCPARVRGACKVFTRDAWRRMQSVLFQVALRGSEVHVKCSLCAKITGGNAMHFIPHVSFVT